MTFSLKRALGLLAIFLALLAILLLLNSEVRDIILARLTRKSVAQRVKAISSAKPWIAEAAKQIQGELVIIVFKNERLVEVHAKGWKTPRVYKMTGFNGKLGPKLREGDGQIPEGVYGVEYLNPNSAFHLSLKVSYPNDTDKRHAKESGRDNLGGDIMIHGGKATVGCVPIGDDAIEEVFFFAAKAGRENTSVIIAPYDMRKGRIAELEQSPLPWYGTLCDEIAAALRSFVHDFPD
jgi:murein L,D-transpeptidase YafK